jgi:hypothetical protein
MSSPAKGSFFALNALRTSAAHANHPDTTQASQTAPSQPTQPGTDGTVLIPIGTPHPTDTSLFVEQNKQPVSSTPQVEASAVTTNTQAPTPAPAATNSDTEPDPEKAQLAAADAAAAAAAAPPAGPVEYAPGTLEDQDRDERRRRLQAKLLIVHTRIAKFVTWLLLLGFVILPGTFKDNGVKNISLYVPFSSLRLLPIFFDTIFLFLSVIIDLPCGDHPIGFPLVTYVASSISPWLHGSGISGRRSTIGYSTTYSSPD